MTFPYGYAVPVLLVLAGLAVLFARGLRARAAVGPIVGDRPRRRWPWARIMTAPYYRRHRGIEHVRDIAYGAGGVRSSTRSRRQWMRRPSASGTPDFRKKYVLI
ncbi:hypothetical protein ABT369_48130 [Dactylosporangium sp. NPDC000244]|uniref:hypothetical protein n=1 Tax=Dactylosporangium sp. NPDC000244 TaxID=3154365 RepID=UPI0033327C7D